MMRTLQVALAALVLSAGFALAQQVVDQGMPGNQGAWPVTASGAGGTGVMTFPQSCAATSVHATTTVGGTSTTVPATAATSRLYIVVCNSAQNPSTAIVKCRSDNTAVVYASTNPGDVLLFGDCVTYGALTANAIRCIADAAAREVLTYECVP